MRVTAYSRFPLMYVSDLSCDTGRAVFPFPSRVSWKELYSSSSSSWFLCTVMEYYVHSYGPGNLRTLLFVFCVKIDASRVVRSEVDGDGAITTLVIACVTLMNVRSVSRLDNKLLLHSSSRDGVGVHVIQASRGGCGTRRECRRES